MNLAQKQGVIYFNLHANYLRALERAVSLAYLRVATNRTPSVLVWNTLVRNYSQTRALM